MLTARSDGTKLKAMVLLPRKKSDKKIDAAFGKKLVLVYEGTVWMNDQLTGIYLDRVFGQSLFGKRLLVWDSFRCHISVDTKRKLRNLKIHTAVIPGGCTKFLQPPDVAWNSPFKAHIKQSYDRWISTEDRMEFTAAGNPRAPSMEVYLDWIHRAWESIPASLITKSFKGSWSAVLYQTRYLFLECGITNAHDGSEDNLIHCYKAHGAIPEGRALLTKEREDSATPRLTEMVDEEEDNANGYVTDDEEVEVGEAANEGLDDDNGRIDFDDYI
jgi:hypothetical protein